MATRVAFKVVVMGHSRSSRPDSLGGGMLGNGHLGGSGTVCLSQPELWPEGGPGAGCSNGH